MDCHRLESRLGLPAHEVDLRCVVLCASEDCYIANIEGHTENSTFLSSWCPFAHRILVCPAMVKAKDNRDVTMKREQHSQHITSEMRFVQYPFQGYKLQR